MVRLTDRPDMTLDVYRGRKTTMQQLSHAFATENKQTHVHFRVCSSLISDPDMIW